MMDQGQMSMSRSNGANNSFTGNYPQQIRSMATNSYSQPQTQSLQQMNYSSPGQGQGSMRSSFDPASLPPMHNQNQQHQQSSYNSPGSQMMSSTQQAFAASRAAANAGDFGNSLPPAGKGYSSGPTSMPRSFQGVSEPISKQYQGRPNVFSNNGSSPAQQANNGNLSSLNSGNFVAEIQPKWGVSRESIKDKLAASFASDTNISCLPGGFKGQRKNSFSGGGNVPMQNYKKTAPTPNTQPSNLASTYEDFQSSFNDTSAISRAQAAIERSRAEIGLTKNMANNLYGGGKNPWSIEGIPTLGNNENFDERRAKQEVYKMELERQIEQSKMKRSEEKRKEHDSTDHPLGAEYAPVPLEAPRQPKKINTKMHIANPDLLKYDENNDEIILPPSKVMKPQMTKNPMQPDHGQRDFSNQRQNFQQQQHQPPQQPNYQNQNQGPGQGQYSYPPPRPPQNHQPPPPHQQQPIPWYPPPQAHPPQFYPGPPPPWQQAPPPGAFAPAGYYPYPPPGQNMPPPGYYPSNPGNYQNQGQGPPPQRQQQHHLRESQPQPGDDDNDRAWEEKRVQMNTPALPSPPRIKKKIEDAFVIEEMERAMREQKNEDPPPEDPQMAKSYYQKQLKDQIAQNQRFENLKKNREMIEDQIKERRDQEYYEKMQKEVEREEMERMKKNNTNVINSTVIKTATENIVLKSEKELENWNIPKQMPMRDEGGGGDNNKTQFLRQKNSSSSNPITKAHPTSSSSNSTMNESRSSVDGSGDNIKDNKNKKPIKKYSEVERGTFNSRKAPPKFQELDKLPTIKEYSPRTLCRQSSLSSLADLRTRLGRETKRMENLITIRNKMQFNKNNQFQNLQKKIHY